MYESIWYDGFSFWELKSKTRLTTKAGRVMFGKVYSVARFQSDVKRDMTPSVL